MYKLRFLSLVLFLVLLSNCAPILATPSPVPASTVAPPTISAAVVQSVEVQILDGEPLQVNAIIRGQLPDGVVQQSRLQIRCVTGIPSISS